MRRASSETIVLDEGTFKNVDEVIMNPKRLYSRLCDRYEWDYWENDDIKQKCKEYYDKQCRNDHIKSELEQIIEEGDPYSNCSIRNDLERQLTKLGPPPKAPKDMKHPDEMSKEALYKYYNILPFHRCIMINISPNWKGKIQMDDPQQVAKAITLINELWDTIFDRDIKRYSRMRYVVECGSDGDFIHCHCVLELNPSMIKSTMNCIKKGNHLLEIRKIWDRLCKSKNGWVGYVGLLKGRYALQSTLLNNELIRDDKLKYLIEDQKPFSHRNQAHPQFPELVDRWGQ